MKISIFFKTFFMLLISFSLVYLGSMYYSYTQFSPMYIDKNIQSVKSSIVENAGAIQNGTPLEDTSLMDLSSETAFIHYQNDAIKASIGPTFLNETNILDFVISIFDHEATIVDGNLYYFVDQVEDIYTISYIYQFEIGDYLIVSTRIQSLRNVDQVLNSLNMTQSLLVLVVILLLSVFISRSISKPIKQIGKYAKGLSELDFNKTLNIRRNDEFRTLTSSLNEMGFHLKKAFSELNEANQKLSSDIDYEKQQEQKKKHLIMTINHEIKTPLAVMKGMVEGMIDGVGRYKDKEKYLKELLVQIETIHTITQDLTYSLKLEDKLRPNEVVNTEVFETLLTPMMELAKQRKIKLIKSFEKGELLMSEELLSILLTNIVKNALLYTTNAMVKVTGEQRGTHYVLSVRNAGHIPEAEIEKLFNSFYRMNTQSEKGSGLGLFIVKQICELYGYTYTLFNDGDDVVIKIHINCK
ncbi:HAMP domain-containing histidine kinase [Acholeplasma vituli]|uniref:histidine kinase n=1 Tax=Paracholeplasma vituli TaxID=69473 RepID=A0ABT2PWX7_9MOLU|nr:HAMP domain-containing sensor histidine kinase [Paracholeplasma vituli]MCU0104941.1 HAMP domain-containing histidine kinase [Paracholeplasma vituli]